MNIELKGGDAQIIGKNDKYHLINGDALTYLKLLPDACISAIICDPPYA